MREAGAVVVSSGRCGSTALSTAIGKHAGTLSLEEFFISVHPQGLRDEVWSGERYFRFLAEPLPSVNTLLRIGISPPEMRHPAHAARDHAISRIGAFTLPAVFDDPGEGMDLLRQEVRRFPEQPIHAHHRALFALLTRVSGKRSWIERSGGSSLFAHQVVGAIPGAKVVYLTRDCVDVALSMSRHPVFQLQDIRAEFIQRCGFDPLQPLRDRRVPAGYERYLPANLTAAVLDERRANPRRFILLGAMMARCAERAIATLPPEHVLRVRYEDLLAEPADELRRVGRFLGLADPEPWLGEAAPHLSSVRAAGAEIDPAERQELRELFDRIARRSDAAGRARAG